MRQCQNLRDKVPDKNGANSSLGGWQMHCEGACAELAVAKFFNLFWSGKGEMDAPDLGATIQVRGTWQKTGRLIVRKDDNPEHLYILVRGVAPNYEIAGWIKGSDAMKDTYLTQAGSDRPAAYFVPAEDLRKFGHAQPV